MSHSASWSPATNIERPPPASAAGGLPDNTAPDSASPVRAIVVLPAAPDQIAAARRFVSDFVGTATLASDAVLCLSEVATNAVIHSNSRGTSGRFTVSAELHGDDCLRIEVADEGGQWLERAKPAGQRHLGLAIVRELASAWGIEGDGCDHRTVWFELRPVSEPSSASVSLADLQYADGLAEFDRWPWSGAHERAI
jgi:anti-sigma regulatory factor (Ser/Thr protein kinase)